MQDYQEIPHENVSVIEEKNQQAKQKQKQRSILVYHGYF